MFLLEFSPFADGAPQSRVGGGFAGDPAILPIVRAGGFGMAGGKKNRIKHDLLECGDVLSFLVEPGLCTASW